MDLWWHKFVLADIPTTINFVTLNESNNAVYSLYWLATTENSE